jgi:hypothetical protein
MTNLNVVAGNITLILDFDYTGISVYGRQNWTNLTQIYAAPPVGSLLLTTSAQVIFTNVTSGASRSLWLHANCVNASTMNATNVTYIVNIQ